MSTNLSRLFRAVVVALVVAFPTAPVASARWRGTATTAATHDERAEHPQRDPMIGVIAIGAGVALLIFLAWVAVRIGDSGR